MVKSAFAGGPKDTSKRMSSIIKLALKEERIYESEKVCYAICVGLVFEIDWRSSL